ncbi:MAG: polysaccharide deacetylase family protein, partial [Phycisphaeraceae bacterium]|nr:polysaccharide deacetylase family protein [Phycisphaeraceae bacterium]
MNEDSPQTPVASSTLPAVRCLSFDVEEYFHIEAGYGRVKRESWDQWPSRVEGAMDRLLAVLDRHGVKATFFVLGDVARRCPRLVPHVADLGHEIASHGFNHDRLHRLTPETFKVDLRASMDLLEQQSGRPVLGYRAPTWSVTRRTSWAVDVLIEEGLRYDASIFPVRHPAYGV